MKISSLTFKHFKVRFNNLISNYNLIIQIILSSSVTFFEPGTHIKRAVSIFYYHKQGKIVATAKSLPFSLKVPVLSIRYLDTLIKNLYHNYTIAACNLLYPNVVKSYVSKSQQYGETVENFNNKIYQWQMNND